MGNILTKNKSDAGNFEKVLYTLDNDIQKSEIRLSELRIQSRRVSAHWLLFTGIVWVVYTCYYFYNLKDQVADMQAVLALPVLLGPLVIFYTRKGIAILYQKSILRQEGKLNSLRKKQKLKLEELKNKTAYYATQSLIDRYDEEKSKKRHLEEQKKKELEERQRKMQQTHHHSNNNGNLPVPRSQSLNTPQQPKWYDKLADALIGEQGPETKYALICQFCSSHNGLALPQEIDDIQYNCPNCGKFNPSRKSQMMNNSGNLPSSVSVPPASPPLSSSSSSSSSSPDVNNSQDKNSNMLRKRNIDVGKPLET